MQTYIALLRGINVSGQKKIKMAEFRSQLEEDGFQEVETYIQSGNIIFQTNLKNKPEIQKEIESTIEKKYNFHVPTLILSPAEISEIIKQNPFKLDNTKNLYVVYFFETLTNIQIKDATDKITSLATEAEEIHITKTHAYLHCPNGMGNSKITNNIFEKVLKISTTTRNWRTTNIILEKSDSQ